MSKYPTFWRSSLTPNHPFREMDQYLYDWMKNEDLNEQVVQPKCEVTEDRNQYFLKLEVPGIPKDQIKIEFHDQNLTVSGERREEKQDDSKKRHLTEFSYGSFMRTFTLPGPIHSEGIQAAYDHGILQITVPKSEVSKAKQIQIR